jgi:hypothetical protein
MINLQSLKQFISAAIICLLISSPANADTVTLTPTVAGYAVDGGTAGNWVIDGIFDTLGTASDVFIRKYRSMDFTQYAEFRGAYEYALPSLLSSAGVSISSASLVLHSSYTFFWIGDSILAYGYAADGVIDLGDFDNTADYAGSAPLSGGSGYYNRTHVIDVTNYVASAVGATQNVGFVTAVSWWDVYATLSPVAELQVVYNIIPADGDINQDGVVNAADVLLAQRSALDEMTPDATQLLRGDVAPPGTPDGRIDTADLQLIARKALGQVTGF